MAPGMMLSSAAAQPPAKPGRHLSRRIFHPAIPGRPVMG
ncbi:hypothetical protein QO018_003739 [Azospirillum picis]|uniref:Uncharacterized protein n=1 Tax=Azospirillum picis TaxID=488438 RepID=A0ABU0MN23_9PROT|nr:hypothetical protein [Azospirillum picis]